MRLPAIFKQIINTTLLLLVLSIRNVLPLCRRTECNCTEYGNGPGVAAKCIFPKRQMLEMKVGDFPENLSKIELSGGRELRFSTEVFSRHPLLEIVKIIGVTKVFVREHSFANMTTNKLVRFEFIDAASLILEGQSWKNLAGPISGLIARVEQVIIQGQAFSWLVDITIKDVVKLELLERAFQLEKPRNNPAEFASTVITLERVHIENLAQGTFQSLVSDVRLISSDIKRVKPDAFNAIAIDNVLIDNTTLHRIESGAFSDKTLIKTLTMRRVKVHELCSGGFHNAFSNIVIAHSRLGVVHSGGMNVTVASVTLIDNIFNKVHSNGMSFTQWSSLSLMNNTFRSVDSEAFIAPLSSTSNSKSIIIDLEPGQHSLIRMPEFNFTGNFLYEIADAAFDFSLNDDFNIFIDNNFFFFKCHCDMYGLVGAIMAGNEPLVYETGYCSVDRTLAKCFHLTEGFIRMWNFTEQICLANERILCEEVQRDAAAIIPPRGISGVITTSILPGLQDIENDNIKREGRLLFTILALIALSVLILIILSGLMWICRKGYCSKARQFLLPSTNSLIDYITRLFSNSGVTPAGSISRLSVHEYAELQRKMEESKADDDTNINGTIIIEDIPLEDKATQTLPEELTQELLQSLKEKLNDPENYSEARDMIEHLYDLIKVEENCNKNYRESTSINIDELDREENVYDIIRPKRYSPPKVKKDVISIGTRAPSPDKLLPYNKKIINNTTTMVADYIEPKDRKIHTYSELPHRPDLLQPAMSTTATPLSDYNEPSDTKVHLYTELPVNIRLANRPLPAQPLHSNVKHQSQL